MNRTSKALALALCLGAATVASAQDATTPTPASTTTSTGVGSIVLGPTLGLSLPFGDFADAANIGINIGLIGDYYMAPNWSLGGEISWHTFGGNDDLEKALSVEAGTPVELKFRALPIVAHAKYFIPAQSMTPYVRAGVGVFNLATEINGGTVNDEDSETNLGFLLGGGFSIPAGAKASYGAEAYYQYISTEGDATNMLVLRGNFMFGIR
jgi:opacity protein-like surface antigen